MSKKMLKASVAGLILSVSGFANAGLITEIGDTGDSIHTAQSLSANTTQISGSISNNSDVDLFGFYWDGGLLDINVSYDNSNLDSQVFLFDGLGFGLYHNDDAPFPNSAISTTVSAGEYFVGVSSFSNDPVSVDGTIFPTFYTGQMAPTGPGGGSVLSGWEYDGVSNGAYIVNISSVSSYPQSVPEPSTLAIFTLAIAGLVSRKFKN